MSEVLSSDVVAAAQALAPQIRAARKEIEMERCLPASLVQEMTRAGLFQMHLPRSIGGLECDPLTAFRATEALASADGSVGWCASISSAISFLVARLPKQMGKKLFGDPPDARLAGSLRPEGRSREVEGGYRVSGRWDFASGINHANWMYCSCVMEDENGPCHTPDGLPLVRAFMIPREAVSLVDTWQVAGMRGTGSKTLVLNDVFVPDYRMFGFEEIYLPRHSEERPDSFWDNHVLGVFGTYHFSCVVSGMARHALEIATEGFREVGPFGPRGGRETMQMRMSEAAGWRPLKLFTEREEYTVRPARLRAVASPPPSR